MRLVLTFLALMTTAVPALAQSQCVEPVPPSPMDGAAASADQMRGAMADARNFISQSAVFQACVQKEADDARAQAASSGQPFDPAILAAAKARIAASQKAQEQVGNASNASLTAYKNAHTN